MPMRRPAYWTLMAALLFLPLATSGTSADVIRLKNGATIAADSWEDHGDEVLVHQGTGTIVVPRAEIKTIEKSPETPGAMQTAPSSGQTGANAAAPASSGAKAGGAAAGRIPPVDLGGAAGRVDDLSPEEIQSRVDDLKRRIRDYPMARAANTRQLVSFLSAVGADAYRKRDYDGALARFREALEYDGHDPHAALGLAAVYVAQGQDIYARSTLEQALVDHPEDPDLLVLLGDVYNSEERPEEALSSWQKAYAARPNGSIKQRIDKLQREHAIDGSYRRSEAAHFTMKYDGDRVGPDLGSQILDALEGDFPDLETRFDYVPTQPIIVIVYPQRQFYEATLAESNVAGLYDGKIRVPIGGLQHLNDEARKVLIHELAHAFIAGKSRGTAPRWLHEGLAQQIEGKTTTLAHGVPLAKEYQELTDKLSWGTSFSYPSALSFVEFLINRQGFPALVDVLQAMGRGATPEAAFEEVTRYSLQELRQAWGEALVAKYLQ
ncbi:MAG TPA: tetratricopeptide repeat protein [Candidatus Polarisedimenticolia bacterium]|nr:tetratricopeptide repeat protein [Candidatus Polarisedimenticolia bacterium]